MVKIEFLSHRMCTKATVLMAITVKPFQTNKKVVVSKKVNQDFKKPGQEGQLFRPFQA